MSRFARDRYVIALVLALPACAPTWRQAARMSEAAAVSSLACDGAMTEQYLADSPWVETNPILGPRPSPALLWTYLAAIGAAVVATNRLASDEVAVAANALVLVVEAKSIATNASVGAAPCGLSAGGPWRPLPSQFRPRGG